MLRPLFGLLLGSAVAYALALVWSPTAGLVAGYALGITLPPAVMTCAFVIRLFERWPILGPAAVVSGAMLRMAWAVSFVSLLGREVEKVGIPRQSLAEWTCGFYLVTLALETAVLWGRLARTGRPTGPPA